MKVLCAAHPISGHILPVAALANTFSIRGHQVETIRYTRAIKNRDHNLATGEYYTLDPTKTLAERVILAQQILQDYEPDIVIVDWRWEFWVALIKCKVSCIISIVRCEQFLGYQSLNPHLPDKFFQSDVDGLNTLIDDETKRIEDRRELQLSDIMVVPSIPELDPSPRHHAYQDLAILYTGYLGITNPNLIPNELKNWIEAERLAGQIIVLITLGTVYGENIYPQLSAYFSKTNLTTIFIVPNEQTQSKMRVHQTKHMKVIGYNDYLHDLLKMVDIVIHHCGHGTNQSVLLAEKPAITISTSEFDREDNALRVQSLQCSQHFNRESLAQGVELEPIIRSMISNPALKVALSKIAQSLREQKDRVGEVAVAIAAEDKVKKYYCSK